MDIPSELTSQLIAYIGNKRRLLPFLGDVVDELASRSPLRTFVDGFSGSGAVARIARSRGLAVTANDWEPYAFVVTAAFLESSRDELEGLFAPNGGLRAALAQLNRVGREGAPAEPYVSRYYAPENTASADYRVERLFYTAENARFLDAVREQIEQWYPDSWSADTPDARAKRLLLALLVYEASTHANTSGVFKAYHKGFGGHGRDALARILAPMELTYPLMPEGPPGRVEMLPVMELARTTAADLWYLDPPYATHQYGSNYFMLNTLVRWDRPIPPEGKAGIRADWTETRSAFCGRRSAAGAMEQLLEQIDAHYVVVSYSSDGLIPAETLYDLLERHGRVELMTTDYTVYRGGRQSLLRQTENLEYVLVLNRLQRPLPADRQRMERLLVLRRVQAALRGRFHPARFAVEFSAGNDAKVPLAPGVEGRSPDGYEITSITGDLGACNVAELTELQQHLERSRCRDHAEEVAVLVDLLAVGPAREQRSWEKRLVWCLSKFAFAKYREQLQSSAERVNRLIETDPARFCRLRDEVAAVLARADRRAQG